MENLVQLNPADLSVKEVLETAIDFVEKKNVREAFEPTEDYDNVLVILISGNTHDESEEMAVRTLSTKSLYPAETLFVLEVVKNGVVG